MRLDVISKGEIKLEKLRLRSRETNLKQKCKGKSNVGCKYSCECVKGKKKLTRAARRQRNPRGDILILSFLFLKNPGCFWVGAPLAFFNRGV